MLTITGASTATANGYVTVDQQNYTCDDLKREDHPQVMGDIKGTHELFSKPDVWTASNFRFARDRGTIPRDAAIWPRR